MIYLVFYPGRNACQIETEEETIVASTPALRWTIGMKLSVAKWYLDRQSAFCREITKKEKRSPSLGTAQDVSSCPSDKELARRTSSA